MYTRACMFTDLKPQCVHSKFKEAPLLCLLTFTKTEPQIQEVCRQSLCAVESDSKPDASAGGVGTFMTQMCVCVLHQI